VKAKLIRPVQCAPSAETAFPDVEKLVAEAGMVGIVEGSLYFPAGTVLESPDAFRLVQMGNAEPADDECRERANMTSEEMQAAQEHQEALVRGIAYEDVDRFKRGEIVGRDEDGEYIPGPNAPPPESDIIITP